MTVAQLIEELQKCSPNCDVVYPYDGPDTYQHLEIRSVIYDQDSNEIVLTED